MSKQPKPPSSKDHARRLLAELPPLLSVETLYRQIMERAGRDPDARGAPPILTTAQVREVRRRLWAGASGRKLAKEFGVFYRTIRDIGAARIRVDAFEAGDTGAVPVRRGRPPAERIAEAEYDARTQAILARNAALIEAAILDGG